MDIGHCSCNGPLDGIKYITTHHGIDSIDTLIATFTEELCRSTGILIDAIKEVL